MARLASLLARFAALPREERLLLALAAILLPLFSVALVVLRTRLERLSAAAQPQARPTLQRARQVAWAVETAARFSPFRASCLTRSLVLLKMLHGHGTLRIGVRPGAGTVDAHAWVEWDGAPINDRPDVAERFAILAHPSALACNR